MNVYTNIFHSILIFFLMVYGIRHFQQYFSYIRKPPTCCKSLTNFIREEYLNELYFVGNCMHTELYLFNVFTLFQDTETVSEHDLSMVDSLEDLLGFIPSFDGTYVIHSQTMTNPSMFLQSLK